MTPDPTAWGIDRGYHDAQGTWREPDHATIDAILAAMGATSAAPAPVTDVWVVRAGESVQVGASADLETEDGRTLPVDGVASNLPLGYHWLRLDDGRRIRLIVSPGRCHLPPTLRAWGWAVQLHSVRSERSWGMGDLSDLQTLATWAAGEGARVVLLSPLHAPAPAAPVQPSPYYPSSRCFRNPLYLAVEEVDGARGNDEVARAAAAGRALNRGRTIDRDAVLELKLEALSAIWQAGASASAAAAIDRYVEARGSIVVRWGQFCTLAEQHGPSWRDWPEPLHRSTSPAVAKACAADRVRFHVWLQMLVDRQLDQPGKPVELIHDLAVGVDPSGADTWLWPDAFAAGVSVGAPPDEYNTEGQDWGLPPFDPWKLRAAHFEPFIETVRAGFRQAGGLRIDHVMGLFRLFWIPEGGGAEAGTYVRYPWEEMLDIVALESHRASAFVVGEDLGTVEPWVRDALAARNVLSYRLLWFEPEPPASYPERSLGAITTHDLPTVAGLWTGSDLAAQRERGLRANVASTEELVRRVRAWTGLSETAAVDEVVREVHRLLALAPSAVVTASLEDALGVEERPNYPGTVGGTNWLLALPQPLEEVLTDRRVAMVSDVLNCR